MTRLTHAFFQRTPQSCAEELIGATLIWDGCRARIVETEAYASEGDPACHTFFKPSSKAFVEEHEAGTAYVYLNYGVHWLFNILVKSTAGDGFVLIRAVEPMDGLDLMRARRPGRQDNQLCSGPGKLTQALGIGRADHASQFLDHSTRGIEAATGLVEVIADGRIGISRAQELPWRFTEKGNRHLSKSPLN